MNKDSKITKKVYEREKIIWTDHGKDGTSRYAVWWRKGELCGINSQTGEDREIWKK